MPSLLDFPNSEVFRKKLIVRNLVPYKKSPSSITPPINYETILRDMAPTDSNDALIDTSVFANQVYPLNQYGRDGGYVQVPDVNTLKNTNSNEGEYDYSDATILNEAQQAARTGFPGIQGAWLPLNPFGGTNTQNQLYDSGLFFTQLEILQNRHGRGSNNQPYPNTFNASSYRASSLILNPDPQGSDGLLSNDSYLAKISAGFYKEQFLFNAAREIRRNTLGRANFLNVNGGANILNILTGRVPILEPNYTISQPTSLLGASADLLNRVSGTYVPLSTIPGSYFDTSINPQNQGTTQQLFGAYAGANLASGIGRFFGRLFGSPKTGSVLFLENTGAGQKSILFKNLEYNIYRPNYSKNIFDRVAGILRPATENAGFYYVGSDTSEPSNIFSPVGDVPTDQFGREVKAPVYGPSELSQLYEGPGKALRLGANGPTYSSGGGIEGGFTWVSPKFRGNAGKYVSPGGDPTSEDPDFGPAGYGPTESTNYTFRQGSILDDTQRIIDSQPRGGKRFQHVGNAIDQVSKVFNDGYKEITKGSKVVRYVGEIGQERGAEYCRIFTKDTPYLQFNDLQKTDGITTQGRKFAYSVFDNTYNLNIAPNKREGGQDSTNIVGGYPFGGGFYAKKYMFSLENLAWRTSNRPGLSVQDLPACERGPNGGRVMWFPPYGLTFSESTRAGFKTTDFIGRPEPVYTYNNTSRTGSLTWKIVVDHPSVLNMLVNRVLSNEVLKSRVDGILESFFAGCRKYDLYELAQKYYTINPRDIFEIQQKLSTKNVTTEEVRYLTNTIQTGNDATTGGGGNGAGTQTNDGNNARTVNSSANFVGDMGSLYFDNDIPLPNIPVESYLTYYTAYTSQTTKNRYQSQANLDERQPIETFYSSIIESNKLNIDSKINLMKQNLSQGGVFEIVLSGSASSPQTVEYNDALSQRRINSVKKYFLETLGLQTYLDNKQITFVDFPNGEKEVIPETKIDNQSLTFNKVRCTEELQGADKIYSTNAMACRRVKLTVNDKTPAAVQQPSKIDPTQPRVQEQLTTVVDSKTVVQQVITEETVLRDNITKRVLRSLLSECDYFEVIKQETPMVYDNLKEKLKFFHPSFHSITPEGLNSRLTFLQQCMRPGDTIPTVNSDGQLEYNNAINTAFGAPPVLVLRVGDFFHSKIIPDNLSLTYEGLDLNPEGIGVQPMIANVTLSFSFVGGQGLKSAVDKLQNALTFNFYGNTEIYDDRADATDDSYKVLDQQFIKNLGLEVPPPTINQVENTRPQSNLETIGKVLTTETNENGVQYGTIEYKTLMTQLVGSTQNYFATIVNKTKDVNSQYNNAIRQLFPIQRNYTNGYILAYSSNDVVNIYGKPINFQKTVDDLFSQYISDIDSENGFVGYMNTTEFNFSKKALRQLKQNMKTFVTEKQNSFVNPLSTIIQSITNAQTQYIQLLAKTNVITYNPLSASEGTDGYQQTNGLEVIYNISGTTAIHSSSVSVTNTYEEISADFEKIANNLEAFDDVCQIDFQTTINGVAYTGMFVTDPLQANQVTQNVFVPFTDDIWWDENAKRREYAILSKDVIDQKLYESFENAIIGNIITNKDLVGDGKDDFQNKFRNYWQKDSRRVYSKEDEVTKAWINEFEKSQMTNYLNYTPFPLDKKRVFTYEVSSTPTAEQKTYIKDLGLKNNTNTDTSKWATINGSVITTKVELL
jgi:outer membrane protein OmpA-like peptidoglycan-associated protein